MAIQICDLSPTDVGAAVRLLEDLKAVPDSSPIEITQFIAEVNDGAVIVVALSEQGLVGLASARVAGDRAWTQLIAIAPNWRGKGIGSALTEGLESRLLHLGVRKVSALVAPGRVGEQALVNRGYAQTTGMVLYEKSLSFEPSEVQIIDRWGGQILDRGLWDQLAGMDREKHLIDARIVSPLANPNVASQVGLRLPSTALLFGPPGTGKTSFARALASRLSWPFIELLPSKLSTGDQPLASELHHALMELGRLDHAVIFIDEFDEIAPARESRPSAAGVVNELLKSIPRLRERPGKLLVCATNFVETIDPAVLRPGRFDLLIGIGPPDKEARVALWGQALAPMSIEAGVNLEDLADKSVGFTPGDVDLAAQRAAADVFMRAGGGGSPVVTADDIAIAVARTRPSVSPDMLDRFVSDVTKFERI